MMQKVPGAGGETQRRGEGTAEKVRGRRGREREVYYIFFSFLNKKNEKMQVKGNLLMRSTFGNIHREGNSIKAASRSVTAWSWTNSGCFSPLGKS